MLAAWEGSPKGVEAVAFMKGLWLAYCRLPREGHYSPPHKGTVLMLRIVQFVNSLRPSNKWPVHHWVYFYYCTSCHVHALFVNGHRLARIGHVHEWDVVVPSFLSQNGEFNLVSSTGIAGTVRTSTPLLTSGYPA